jgi:chitodextrinase
VSIDRLLALTANGDGQLFASTAWTNHTDTAVLPLSAHTYQIYARDSLGNMSPPSNLAIAVPPPDSEPPIAPGSLTSTATSPVRADLNWIASTDNVGVAGYFLYRNGVIVASTGATTFSDIGLTPLTIYNYKVRARDAAGNVSGSSGRLIVTTPQ